MKRVLYLAAVLMVLAGCKKDYRTNLAVIDVEADYWEYVENKTGMNQYFAARFDMPEISKEVFDNGILNVYALLGNNDVQQQLPYTRHFEYVNENTNEINFYTVTIDYDWGVGFLNVYYTANDFAYELDETINPEIMRFRVVMMW